MSHPTVAASPRQSGELHVYTRETWRQARTAQADGQYTTAAWWWKSAADSYAELATATSASPYRAAAWRNLADEANTNGYRAWAAAHPSQGRQERTAA